MKEKSKPFIKGYKFRIYPTKKQKELFENTFGCCRYIYNTLLDMSIKEYENYKESIKLSNIDIYKKPNVSGFYFTNKLLQLKNDPDKNWLNNVSAVALQQSALHLGGSFKNFFKLRKGYPKFKKKNGKQSFSLTKAGFCFKDKNLYIIKSKEPITINYHRELPSYPSSLAISRTPSGKYYISFTCRYIPNKTFGTKITGVDVGLTHLMTLSDGTKIDNEKRYKKYEKKLRRLQQSLSRKEKGSKNKYKARIKVAIQHQLIVNSRNDQLHKLSRTLVNENQVIGIEKLKIVNMVKNHKLAKSIHDVAWGTFFRFLLYKATESQNCKILLVETNFPSSHLCSNTGKHIGRKLKLNERTWNCPHCNKIHDRDINAAKNILNEVLKYKI